MDKLRVDKTYECPETYIIFMPQEKSVKLKNILKAIKSYDYLDFLFIIIYKFNKKVIFIPKNVKYTV